MSIWEDSKKTLYSKRQSSPTIRYNLGTVHRRHLTMHLNNAAPSIKFTHEIFTNSVNFLDTTVLKDRQGNISTDVYQKPHPYLHWTSAHPPDLKHLKYAVKPDIETEKNMLFHRYTEETNSRIRSFHDLDDNALKK